MKRPRKISSITKAVNALSTQAREAAEQAPNPLADLTSQIKLSIDGEVDAYLLVGVLLEGIVQTLTTRIPSERQPATELATLLMLKQRLESSALCRQRPDPCA